MRHRKIALGLMAFSTAASLLGCSAQHDFTAVQVKETVIASDSSTKEIGALSLSDLKVVPYYGNDGHIATSGFIADMLGVKPERIAELSCYSQAPDDLAFRYSAPWVGLWGLPAYFGYRHEIVNSLHSLHGGDAQAVVNRRSKLERLAHQSFISDQPDWQTGFLIHAMGDSYAHVYMKDGELHSYGEFVGHVFENTPWGEKPDSIFVNGHAEIYLSYVSALFRALSPAGGASDGQIRLRKEFEKRIRAEAQKGDDADKTAIFVMPSDPKIYIDADNSKRNCKAAYAKLKDDEVRAFLRSLTAQLAKPGS